MQAHPFSFQHVAAPADVLERERQSNDRFDDVFGDDPEYPDAQRPLSTSRTRQKRAKREGKTLSGLMKQRTSHVLTYEALLSVPDLLSCNSSRPPRMSWTQAGELLAVQSMVRPTRFDDAYKLREEVHFKVLCAFSNYEKTGEWPELSPGMDCSGCYGEEEEDEVYVSTQQWLALLTLFPALVHRLAAAVDMHVHQRLESTRLQLIRLTVALRREMYLDYLIQRVPVPLARPVIAQPIHVRPRPPTAPIAPPA